ncbi:Transcription initiation factor IIA subunit 2-like protein [Drosera capensis]
MVDSGTLSPHIAMQVLIQFDKSMTDALENWVKSKVTLKGHLHTYRFIDNVWTFILQDTVFKNKEGSKNIGGVKIVACDSKLLVHMYRTPCRVQTIVSSISRHREAC